MNEIKKVSYPDSLLLKMKVESTIFSPHKSDIGVAILSEKINSDHVLRIYHLLFNNEKEVFNLVQELAAFTFNHRNELTSFLTDLPHLNGLEMLILLNPLNQHNSYLN